MRKSQPNQSHDGTADFLIRRGVRARSIDVRPQDSNVPEEATNTTSRPAARLVSRPQLLSTRQRLDIVTAAKPVARAKLGGWMPVRGAKVVAACRAGVHGCRK